MKCERNTNVWVAMVMAATLTGLFVSAESPAASFTVLELPTEGSSTYDAAISADGSTVAGNYYDGSRDFAFIWTAAGGSQSIGELGGYGSHAYDISSDGSTVVGTSVLSFFTYPFKWTAAGGMEALEILGATDNAAYGVSADGSVVVGYSNEIVSDDASTVRWTSDGNIHLLGIEGDNSVATAVSADGSVIVGYWTTAGFRWTAESGMETLPTLGGNTCHPQCISDDGTTIAGISTNSDEADCFFRWTEDGGMENLGVVGMMGWCEIFGISADGSVIVGTIEDTAFIWTEATGILDLKSALEAQGVDLENWTLSQANDITILPDGSCSIVGYGWCEGDYYNRTFLINMGVPVPEPATIALLAAGGIALLRRNKKIKN